MIYFIDINFIKNLLFLTSVILIIYFNISHFTADINDDLLKITHLFLLTR